MSQQKSWGCPWVTCYSQRYRDELVFSLTQKQMGSNTIFTGMCTLVTLLALLTEAAGSQEQQGYPEPRRWFLMRTSERN